MAEIFGVLAAVVGVLDVVTRVSMRLIAIKNTWKKAPLEILALSNEVTDLNIVLHYTRDACKRVKTGCANAEFTEALDEHIRTATLLLTEVDKILSPLPSMKELKKRRKWLQLKKSLIVKKNELNDVRTRIRDLLQAYHM
jgi:hypothetical protein